MEGEANLRRKEPAISKLVGHFPETHYLCILDTLNSVLISNNTISRASRCLDISGVVVKHDGQGDSSS